MSSSSGSGSGTRASANASASIYFCHECNQRTAQLTDSFTCPNCGSGFVELLEDGDPDEVLAGNEGDDWGQDETPIWGPAPPNVIGGGGDFGQLIQHIFAAAGGANHATTPPMPMEGAHGGGRHRGAAARHARGPPRRHAHHSFYVGGAGPGAIHIGGSGPGGGVGGGPFLQELLQSLGATIQAGAGGHDGAVGGEDGAEAAAAFNFVPGFQMYGNPGDYAWGRGGLDVIVTQLLNQMDGTGPPPLKGETIEKIPKVKVTQEHVDQKTQCSVCWEDFVLSEEVRKLNCDHIFHEKCIFPWLELHGTCPICRKSQEVDGGGGGSGHDEQAPHAPPSRAGASDPTSRGSRGSSTSHENPVGGTFAPLNSILNMLGYNRGGGTSSASSPSAPATSTQPHPDPRSEPRLDRVHDESEGARQSTSQNSRRGDADEGGGGGGSDYRDLDID